MLLVPFCSRTWQSPPNFLRASALAEHVKPVVVIPEEAPEDEEPENLIEISTAPSVEQPVRSSRKASLDGCWPWVLIVTVQGAHSPASEPLKEMLL